jgi:Ca2+-binding EF-hand superfamily protein
MRALGFDVKKAEVLKLMKEFDRKETGHIEYQDFVDIMTQKMAERDPEVPLPPLRALRPGPGLGVAR